MTSLEFATLCDIERSLSRIVELFELMDNRLRNLESSLIEQSHDRAPSTPNLKT